MATATKLPLWAKIHNMTCPAWLLKINFLRKIEPGCRAVANRLKAQGK
jgi:hypothetical protein